jgi:hypothetical protein
MMPLDAQDRIELEKLEDLFRRAARRTPLKTRLELVSAAKVLTLSIFEMCPPSELRKQILTELRSIAAMVAAAAVEADTEAEEEKAPAAD